MRERTEMLAAIRAELMGPAIAPESPTIVQFTEKLFTDPVIDRRGPIFWSPNPDGPPEEVLYFDRETPHRKYGIGLLHPQPTKGPPDHAQQALELADTMGVDNVDTDDDSSDSALSEGDEHDDNVTTSDNEDFDVTSPDARRPSSLGISCCVCVPSGASIVIRLPRSRRYSWQQKGDQPRSVNGRYERGKRIYRDNLGHMRETPVWRRISAMLPDTEERFPAGSLHPGQVLKKDLELPQGSPIRLSLEIFPRPVKGRQDTWLVTIVLRNITPAEEKYETLENVLYQTFFDVSVEGGKIMPYPESERPFAQLDREEQSLMLLYRESSTWGIGHGCAAGWDAGPGEEPNSLFADVMPVVETPSMTPDIIEDASGAPIRLFMRDLAQLPDSGSGPGWDGLRALATNYREWINRLGREAEVLEPAHLRAVANTHVQRCGLCLERIERGINLLESDADVRHAFRLTNLAMLLQQIATKQLKKRELELDSRQRVRPAGEHRSPWGVFNESTVEEHIGAWRAFQVAFLLMQLPSMSCGTDSEREIVDLIWFPTGGGKTEAYLGVMAFYMFHQRLLMRYGGDMVKRDGTNVLMRYTLRMLTTQQFQRAASLVCAMEFLRRTPDSHGLGELPGDRFALALWIGADGAPNKIDDARTKFRAFREGNGSGNPLVLTECPWCRSQIGRLDKPNLPRLRGRTRSDHVAGVTDDQTEGPLLHCPDPKCCFGAESRKEWLPIEVIDERIYRTQPSLVIATADKFAMLAYRPEAGALFGRIRNGSTVIQDRMPPGLIIQDELHLIAGPLGTMYGLYEGVIERLCSHEERGAVVLPKLIASTATIRGVDDQVRALYGRLAGSDGETNVQLFPSPGLTMGDSFFGVYARKKDRTLEAGRLYLGIHASDYGSVLTTQVRAFSAALYRAGALEIALRDPWWTLLVFYNSLRELGGAKTLFDADIRARLKFLQNREGVVDNERRALRIVDELTSRLSQAEIVEMLNTLSTTYTAENNRAIDACLASSIIEVGVDIDRLSLMGIVGQPKTTAQYIQVSGRVGRRWWERPGMILMVYNPSKSRDRSHFEQFHSYHRRLYERVEPTSATPFAPAALRRGLIGALVTWARQQSNASVEDMREYQMAVEAAFTLLSKRCELIQLDEDREQSLAEMQRLRDELLQKWSRNPQDWEKFPPLLTGEYLLLWPGQFHTSAQKKKGVEVPSSMRQVDGSAELKITQAYT